MPVAKHPFVTGPNPTMTSRMSQRERNLDLCSGCRNSPSGSHQAETDTTVQHHTFHQSHNTEGTKSQGCPGLQKERVSGLPSLTRKGTNYFMHNSLVVYSCPPCHSNLTQNKLFWNVEKSSLCLSFYQTQGIKVQCVGWLLQIGWDKKKPKHLLQVSHPLLLLHFCLLSPRHGLRIALRRGDRSRLP